MAAKRVAYRRGFTRSRTKILPNKAIYAIVPGNDCVRFGRIAQDSFFSKAE